MNDWTDPQLLQAYAEGRSEAAFAEIVRRHVDFVYSAAVRMVCDPHLAEDVTQGVFVALAKGAGPLAGRPVLSGWLHRTAQNIAAQTVRTIERRRAREQEAAAMNELFSAGTDASWKQIAPHLDAALGELGEVDRDALLLRYFERKSAHQMAQTLGVSNEAAQKRVSRAVERLREFLVKRGVTAGASASGLVVVLSANAVQAAPVGLAVTISTAAALAGTTFATAVTATATATKSLAMTTMQKTLIAALAVAVGGGVYQTRQVSSLKSQVHTAASFAEQVELLTRERDEALNKLASLPDGNELLSLRANRTELMRLRAEVTRLRAERADLERRWRQETNGMRVNGDPKPTFEHRFLSRSTWTNAGLATPELALETLLWAWTSRNEAALSQVSVSDTNGLPIGLTGLSVNFQDKLMGAQILRINAATTNLDVANVSAITEYRTRGIDQNGQSIDGIGHGLLTLRFEKSNGEWRFTGQDRVFERQRF